MDEVTLSIFTSPDDCPRTLRYICGCLQRAVVAKWPHERLVRTRVVSGFIFLRLLCPAILNPRSFNLIAEPPSPGAARYSTCYYIRPTSTVIKKIERKRLIKK